MLDDWTTEYRPVRGARASSLRTVQYAITLALGSVPQRPPPYGGEVGLRARVRGAWLADT
jgi:hypothetical protein